MAPGLTALGGQHPPSTAFSFHRLGGSWALCSGAACFVFEVPGIKPQPVHASCTPSPLQVLKVALPMSSLTGHKPTKLTVMPTPVSTNLAHSGRRHKEGGLGWWHWSQRVKVTESWEGSQPGPLQPLGQVVGGAGQPEEGLPVSHPKQGCWHPWTGGHLAVGRHGRVA